LRDAMRDGYGDDDITDVIRGSLMGKNWRWGGSKGLEELREQSKNNRAMTAIGG